MLTGGPRTQGRAAPWPQGHGTPAWHPSALQVAPGPQLPRLGNRLLSCPCSMQQILDSNNCKALIKSMHQKKASNYLQFSPSCASLLRQVFSPSARNPKFPVQGLRVRPLCLVKALHRQPTTLTAQLYLILPLL